MTTRRKTQFDRFWELTAPDGECFIWKGNIRPSGHGWCGGKEWAHRVAFSLYYGYKPKVVLHLCNRPACVNPLHLKDGTRAENAHHAAVSGAYLKKLTHEQAAEIAASVEPNKRLAEKHGVDPSLVSRIKRRQRHSLMLSGWEIQPLPL